MWSNLFPQFITAGSNSLSVVSTTTPEGSQTNWNMSSSTYQQKIHILEKLLGHFFSFFYFFILLLLFCCKASYYGKQKRLHSLDHVSSTCSRAYIAANPVKSEFFSMSLEAYLVRLTLKYLSTFGKSGSSKARL